MRHLFLIICWVTALQLSALQNTSSEDSISQWTPEWQNQYISDRENPAKWDSIHYRDDLHAEVNHTPMKRGVFPVPNYDLYAGTFDGIVAASFDIDLPSGQRVACMVSGNHKTSLNESFLGDNDVDFYFILAVVTDMPRDTVTYDDTYIDGISRNHPDVISEGYVRISQTDRVDFISFRAANNDAYAIVNMRLFNLNFGNLIVIVPQQDGSLRSMQIKPDELITFPTLRKYITTLFTENEKVSKFITTRRDEFNLPSE
ncbi:MAG: hypothetical protein K2L14_04185 [Duncaniella sp.]|nr:hypothetical protein [Duncaniella sp.]